MTTVTEMISVTIVTNVTIGTAVTTVTEVITVTIVTNVDIYNPEGIILYILVAS